MLWCGNSRRYGIHNCFNIIQHGTARAIDWEKAPRRDRYDNAQTDAIQVTPSDVSHIYDINGRYEGTKDRLVPLWFWVEWIPQDPSSSLSIHMVQQINFRT